MPSGSRFKIRLIKGSEDLSAILELRSVCFLREFFPSEYDLLADHLVVEDTERNLLVGAYRLMLNSKMVRFESQEDFELGSWLKRPGIKVELAWACTRPGYRQGGVIALLWKGLAEYLKSNRIQYLFGPASLATQSENQVHQVVDYLKAHHYDLPNSEIEAKKRVLSGELKLTFIEPKKEEAQVFSKRKLPALMRAYLMAGALVLLQPVFDPDTNCFDFMTVLELDHCNEAIRHHFDL